MRPKHTLWLLVAIVSSAWYLSDPQARESTVGIRGNDLRGSDGPAIAGRAARPEPSIVARAPL